ncbi:MAG: BppU family phage baseplate upper protein [Carnobacterium sp.]|uniref:BppU family phage baseplate upper protein n=2 Tax=Carnobacterium sp. TaxID=48221 RepID=UPI002FCB7AAA
MSNYDLKLSTTQPNHVEFMEFRQDDILSRTLNVAITSHDLPRDLTGYDVFLNSTLPSRNIARDKVTNFIDKVNGKFSYTLIDSFVQDTGRVATWFSIEKGGSTTQVGEVIDSTTNFSFSVVPGYRNCVKQGNYIWEFEELLRYVTGLANQSQVQLDKLINDVSDIQQQIDDMFALIASQGVLSADEVRQLMINFMSGQDIEVTVKSDFTGKVMGSIVENGNVARRYVGTAIPSSPPTGYEYGTQAAYDAIKKLEGTLSTQSTNTGVNASIPWHVIQFNVLWILEQNFPSLFKNATTIAEKVAIAKKVYVLNSCSLWVKGSGPSGNLATVRTLNANGVWVDLTNGKNTTNEVKRITSSSNDSNRITADGYLNSIVFAEASNATIASSVSVDYASIDLTVKFNISDFVPTRQEFDTHVLDAVKHITAAERTKWNAKQDVNFKQVTGATGLNGWYAYNNTPMLITREGRLVNLVLQLNAGVQTSGTEMLTLPDWAIPQVGGTTLTAMSVSKDWAYKPCTVVVRGNKLIVGANVDNFLTIISVTYIAAV